MDLKTFTCVILFVAGFGSLIAYADNNDVDRLICNGDQVCMQEMQLGKIDERLESARADLQMADKALGQMIHYDGIWPKTEESRDWYQGKRGLVCSTNRKTKREIPVVERDLKTLHFSNHAGISNRAKLKLEDIQTDPVIKFFLTDTPCQRAEQACKHFECTEIIEGSL